MDQPSQRMPLPIDLMLDPATHHVDAPAAPWDSPVEAEAKGRLSELDGFALSGEPAVRAHRAGRSGDGQRGLGQAVPARGRTPSRVPATVELLADKVHIIVTPKTGRLAEKTLYAVVVSDAVRDAAGLEPTVMPIGHFLQGAGAGRGRRRVSQVLGVADRDAVKLEASRAELQTALDALGRDHVLAAWPFTTMSVSAPLVELRERAATFSVSPGSRERHPHDPGVRRCSTSRSASARSSTSATSTTARSTSPIFLDPVTRAWRADGWHAVEPIKFTMTVPKNPPARTDAGRDLRPRPDHRAPLRARGRRRARGQGLRRDLDRLPVPRRAHVLREGRPDLASSIRSTAGSTSLDPCAAGSTCNDLGKCVDASGNGNHLATFGVIDMPVASGARFLEIDHIANSKDHFQQALVDLGSLDRSLRVGNWQARDRPPGRHLEASTTRGSRSAGSWARCSSAPNPDIPRAVLNVPGAGPRSRCSTTRRSSRRSSTRSSRARTSTRESFEGRRFLDGRAAGSWTRSTRSTSVRSRRTRALMIQMATLDFIIPNANTKVLEQVTGAPRRDYVAEHAFLTIPRRARVLAGHAGPGDVPRRGAAAMSHDASQPPRVRCSRSRYRAVALARPRRRASPSASRTRCPRRPAVPAPRATTIRGRPGTIRRRSPTAAAGASASRSRSRGRRSRRARPMALVRVDTEAPGRRRRTSTRASRADRWAAGLALGVPFGGGVTVARDVARRRRGGRRPS